MRTFGCIFAGAVLLAGLDTMACDVCATHVAPIPAHAVGRFSASMFGQYSSFDPTAEEPESYRSHTTQFGVGYRFDEKWSVQLGLPYLDRRLDDRTEAGAGDLTAVATCRLRSSVDHKGIRFIDVYAGLKAPTGDSDALADEQPVAIDSGEPGHEHVATDPEESGEGHHLALGSGSWDGLLGVHAQHMMGSWVGLADAQYVVKTEGDYDYEYGDEFTWRIGGQYVAIPDGQKLLAVGVDLTGEISGDNKVRGETQADTGKTATYLGPALSFALKERLTIAAAYDFPILGGDEGLHGAADERVRASVSFLF